MQSEAMLPPFFVMLSPISKLLDDPVIKETLELPL